MSSETTLPAPLPLSGCVISMSGALPGPPGHRTQVEIKEKYLDVLGASYSKNVTSTTTHLVCGEGYFRRWSHPKTDLAEEYDIPIVTFHWLEDSLKNNKRMDEETYRFGSGSHTSIVGTRRKRQQPDDGNIDDDDDDTRPQAKRGKIDKTELKEGKAKIGEAQIALTRDVTVPLDLGAQTELPGYEVFINDAGVIYDASLSQASSSGNVNKFYRIQILRSLDNKFYCRVRWGRVGAQGATKIHGDGSQHLACMEFQSKFREKTGLIWVNRAHPPRPKKYIFIERCYDVERKDGSEDGVKIPSRLSKPVQELMKLIFNQQYFAATMSELNYNANSLPLGKLSMSTITRGYEALTDLSALLHDHSLATTEYQTSFDSAVEELSNLYFSLIPHVFGRNKPPVIKDPVLLKKEIELLESLSDMKEASLLMSAEGDKEKLHPTDQQFNSLGLDEMTPLDRDSQEFLDLKDLLLKTQGATHQVNYEISQIFRVSRKGEKERLKASYDPPQSRQLLWHGSRCTNFGGILSHGLRIAPPEAPNNVFGKGIYLADTSSKSANYCFPNSSNGHALLLLCEAELGHTSQVAMAQMPNAAEAAKAGRFLSTWGLGQNGPASWKDAGYIHPSLKGIIVPDTQGMLPTGIPSSLVYNEYVCYDVAQVRLRYLFRIRM
ncbi:PARP-domain-containing protein [Annulohypoxylon maeteangense]|uniref:PARP-domain-containing protein n=1 Tax=Annulohypoxylon maeteangense TaxID=1927788 RepID=UPI00200877FC|nr:PARP-domain-containing protein [Annulohypoxylon maeteangense]KAI0889458.1 PARP-domain-containing protein [Annulohypoxylon maeteangense]